jgi:hypothetical protein
MKVTGFGFRRLGYPLEKNCRTGNGRATLKNLQFPFGNCELREAAMETDHELRKNKHQGFVQTFGFGEMNGNFAVENALLV